MTKKQMDLKGFVNLYLFRTTIDQYEKNSVLTVRKVERPDTGRYRYIQELEKIFPSNKNQSVFLL
jgi:hypothetical protein